jgi:deoxyribonuclease V
MGRPTIGVAKSRLFGEVERTKIEDEVVFLKNKGAIIGAIVTVKRGCKPLYVSVGHMVSLETAIRIVEHCVCRNRIPEPILKAHEIATQEKRKFNMTSAINK